MGKAMRWIVLILIATGAALASPGAEISGARVQTVYLLPMAHGLDQFVANRLTREHLLEVVADPKRADAVFTDRLGEAFESQLDDLYPAPKPAAPKPAAEPAAETQSEGAKDAGPKDHSAKDGKSKEPTMKGDTLTSKGDTLTSMPEPRATVGAAVPVSSFGRGKGTLFLVDAHSRAVLWSIYEKPGRTSPDQLDKVARRVVDRLKHDLQPK